MFTAYHQTWFFRGESLYLVSKIDELAPGYGANETHTKIMINNINPSVRNWVFFFFFFDISVPMKQNDFNYKICSPFCGLDFLDDLPFCCSKNILYGNWGPWSYFCTCLGVSGSDDYYFLFNHFRQFKYVVNIHYLTYLKKITK